MGVVIGSRAALGVVGGIRQGLAKGDAAVRGVTISEQRSSVFGGQRETAITLP